MLGQIISILAMAVTIVSFQMKTRKQILLFQTAGSTLFLISFILLGSWAAACLNVVFIIRNIVFYFSVDKKWAQHQIWLYILLAAVIAAGALGYHTWLDLIPEKCFGNEITVTFRYKAAKKGVYPKKASARLRYAEGDIYYKGPTGKPIVLTPSDEWKTASCTMKFPAKLEQAMIVFSTGGADYYVTDMKVSKKNKKQKQTQAQTRSLK